MSNSISKDDLFKVSELKCGLLFYPLYDIPGYGKRYTIDTTGKTFVPPDIECVINEITERYIESGGFPYCEKIYGFRSALSYEYEVANANIVEYDTNSRSPDNEPVILRIYHINGHANLALLKPEAYNRINSNKVGGRRTTKKTSKKAVKKTSKKTSKKAIKKTSKKTSKKIAKKTSKKTSKK